MRVGDEQRTVLTAGGAGEVVSVDETNSGLDRIDAEPRPGEVEEGQRRQHVAADPLVGSEQLDRAFEDERRPRDGVEDLAVLSSAGDEPLDDLGIDVDEAVGRFVDVVEAGRRADEVRSRMAGGADVAVGDPRHGGQRFGGDVSLAARAEPDDRDEWQGSSLTPDRAGQRSKLPRPIVRSADGW